MPKPISESERELRKLACSNIMIAALKDRGVATDFGEFIVAALNDGHLSTVSHTSYTHGLESDFDAASAVEELFSTDVGPALSAAVEYRTAKLKLNQEVAALDGPYSFRKGVQALNESRRAAKLGEAR